MEGLGEEALDFAGAEDGEFVFGGKLVHAENRDDVLKVLVALEHLLHAAGDAVVFFADDFGSECLRGRCERIDGWEERLLGERTLEHDGGVEVSEGVGGGGVGEVVRRHIDRLDRGDRAFVGRGDPLLEGGHFLGEGWLVTHGRWGTAKERGNFGSGLRETEDVVDEEKNVLVVLIAEVLGHGECREGDAETRAGRLVHLAVAEGDLRAFGEDRVALAVEFHMAFLILFGGDNARLDHFPVEVVALTGTLADAGEHRETAVCFGDVVDELHDHDRLADARATEHAALTALEQRADEVDDLDAGGKDFRGGRLLGERWCRAMDWRAEIRVGDRCVFIDEVAGDIEDATKNLFADRHGDRFAGVGEGHAALEAIGGGHRNCAHPSVAKVLLHLEHELGVDSVENILDFQRVVDLGKLGGLGEIGVDDGADDLDDSTLVAHWEVAGWEVCGVQ